MHSRVCVYAFVSLGMRLSNNTCGSLKSLPSILFEVGSLYCSLLYIPG